VPDDTLGSRPGHDIRDGRSDRRQPIVPMVFSPLSGREGNAYARRRAAMGGVAIISDEGARGSSRACDDLSKGFFSYAFSPQLRHDRSHT
jgi:hypothetical protein